MFGAIDHRALPFRVLVENSQLALRVEDEQTGDEPIQQGDSTVLYVSKEVSEALDGATIDAEETPEGKRLTLNRA